MDAKGEELRKDAVELSRLLRDFEESEAGELLAEDWARTFPGIDLERGDPTQTYKPQLAEEAGGFELVSFPTLSVASELEDPGAATAVTEALPDSRPSLSEAEAILSASTGARYEMVAELAQGGMGAVFRARQRSLRREIAIKKMLAEAADSPLRWQFLAEALITGQLDHPNIVPVHDLGVSPAGELLLAMKLVGGTEWRKLLHPKTQEEKKRAKSHELEDHLEILLKVCDAMAFAHSRGIVHLDLKPANIMIGEFGEVLVMDWGLALSIAEESKTPTLIRSRSAMTGPAGTPAYMAPELAEGRGKALGPWTDVYLLGAILYEICNGVPPHRGKTLRRTLIAASRSERPRFIRGAPEELRQICTRAMSRSCADRYQSIEDFRRAVQGYLRHRESVKISERAGKLLSGCEAALGKPGSTREALTRDRLYSDFSEAIEGFRQALFLWKQNRQARRGVQQASRSYARVALANGDLALAEAQLARLDPKAAETGALVEEVARAQDARRHSLRSARRLRYSLIAAVSALFLGLVGGLAFAIHKQGVERALRIKADRAQALAEEKSKEAERERAKAIAEAERADRERREAEAAREDALKESRRAEKEKRSAESASRRALKQLAIAHGERARAALASGDMVSARLHGARALKLWEHPTFRELLFDIKARSGRLRVLRPPLPPRSEFNAAFSPDGTRVALARYNALEVQDLRSGAILFKKAFQVEGKPLNIGALVFGARALAVFGGGFWHRDKGSHPSWIHLLAPSTGETILKLSGPALSFDPTGAHRMAFSRDGRLFAAPYFGKRPENWREQLKSAESIEALPSSSLIKVWDLERRELAATLRPQGRSGHIASLAFAPDGKSLAFARDSRLPGEVGTVRLIELASGKLLARFEGHSHWVYALAFSPDGELLASAGIGRTILVHRRGDASKQLTLEGHGGRINALAFSSDNKLLASASADGSVRLWDVTRGRQIRSHRVHDHGDRGFSGRGAKRVGFGRAGALLLSAGRQRLALWDFRGRERSFSIKGHQGSAHQVAFDPKADVIGSVGDDRALCLWDSQTGDQLMGRSGPRDEPIGLALTADSQRFMVADRAGAVTRGRVKDGRILSAANATYGRLFDAVALHPGSDRVATADKDGAIALWTRTDIKSLRSLKTPAAVRQLAFSPDGAVLASAGADGALRLWNAATGEPQQVLEDGDEPLTSLAFHPEQALVASGAEGGEVRLWDRERGLTVRRFAGLGAEVLALAFSPDGGRLAAGDRRGRILLWASADGRALQTLEDHEGAVHSLAFSPGGERLASAGADRDLRLWDAEEGRLRARLVGHNNRVTALRFSPDGRRLFSAGCDLSVRVWEASEGRPVSVARIQRPGALSAGSFVSHGLAFDPRGRTIAVVGAKSGRGAVQLRDRESGDLLATRETTSRGDRRIAFHPDGSLFASAGEGDPPISLWDGSSGERIRSLGSRGKTNAMSCALAFHPRGRMLASADEDGVVRLWDPLDGSLIRAMKGHELEARGLAFHPKDPLLASIGAKTIRLWNIEDGRLLRTVAIKAPYAMSLDRARALAFNRDGRVLVYNEGQELVFWQLASASKILVLPHRKRGDFITSLAFSADGETLAASHSKSGLLEVWRLGTILDPAEDLEEEAERETGFRLDGWKLAPRPR